MATSNHLLLITLFSALLVTSSFANEENGGVGVGNEVDAVNVPGNANLSVTYDGRSLIVNGKRELLFSGAIHYPRIPPEAWEDIIIKAKRGGLTAVETYVFWNFHEPVQGKYEFEGEKDLARFIKLIAKHKMYAILRVGPFIQAEWNHGGLPYWLREIPNMIFRSDNEPWKYHMKKFVTTVVEKMKAEKLFFPQGGPIILAQIENEYNTIQLAFREKGESYVEWAAKFAVSLNAGVPWVMCKQRDAPDPVINSCNGRHCGDTFPGPNKPYKPYLWTENWTAQYRVFGDPPSQRSAEDLAYSIIRFFSKNGTLVNYYMYHGGTNYGRTAAAFSTTRYYDEAPLDEYGLTKEPKYSHLKDAHRALLLCRKALFWGSPTVENLGPELEARIWEQPGTPNCAAFLANNDTSKSATVNFRGREYYLLPNSINVLPDCKTLVFSSHMITAQHNSRNMIRSPIANKIDWSMHREVLPTQAGPKTNEPMELYLLTKDTTDYGWYTTSVDFGARDLPMKEGARPIIRVASLGHGIHVLVNGQYVGSAHGSKVERNFVFQKDATFVPGKNTITLLCYTVGLPDSGAYMEHRFAGPRSVTILGMNTGTIDLSLNGWENQVGLTGEIKRIFTEEGSKSVEWTNTNADPNPLTWYKGYFDAPEGNNPVAIRMNGMGKGMVWINGRSIGRYWMSYLSPLKQPTQSEYHIPRAWLKPTRNLILIFEEEQGNPKDVEIVSIDRDTICSYVSEFYPPSVRLFESIGGDLRAKTNDLKTKAELKCPDRTQKIIAVEFASFGDPFGSCGSYALGNCTSPVSKQIVEKFCLGKPICQIPVDPVLFGNQNDACSKLKKTLAVQVNCG